MELVGNQMSLDQGENWNCSSLNWGKDKQALTVPDEARVLLSHPETAGFSLTRSQKPEVTPWPRLSKSWWSSKWHGRPSATTQKWRGRGQNEWKRHHFNICFCIRLALWGFLTLFNTQLFEDFKQAFRSLRQQRAFVMLTPKWDELSPWATALNFKLYLECVLSWFDKPSFWNWELGCNIALQINPFFSRSSLHYQTGSSILSWFHTTQHFIGIKLYSCE